MMWAFTKLVKAMFPDSSIAKYFQGSRTEISVLLPMGMEASVMTKWFCNLIHRFILLLLMNPTIEELMLKIW